MTPAHKLSAVVEAGLAPSEMFLVKRLRAGKIPGRKIGREWRMTDSDVQAYLDSMSNTAPTVDVPRIGLTAASMRRRSA